MSRSLKILLAEQRTWIKASAFVLAVWAISRVIIMGSMIWIAPALPAPEQGIQPTPGIGVLSWWDSGWYGSIVENGYDYARDGKQHSIAFFPLYPLLVKGFMWLTRTGYEIAGPAVNNITFLICLFILFFWVRDTYGAKTARWATAILAFCPLSLFGTVAYSEGVFLMSSTASLWAFEKNKPVVSAVFGSLATATRITGAALIPAFILASWQEKRSFSSYFFALMAGGGLALFCLYSAIRFDDPLAFLHVQSGWRTHFGIHWQGWADIFLNGLTGPVRWEIWPPSGGLSKIILVFGGLWLLIALRKELGPACFFYGLFSMVIILASGSIISVDRYAYAIIPLSIGVGMHFSRHAGWGWIVIIYCGILLGNFSIRFAQRLWVA